MNPVFTTGFCFFLSTIFIFIALGLNQHAKKLLKKHWKILIVLVLLSFAFKFPINSEYFDGLEYEDSYIYKAAARSIYEKSFHPSELNPYFPASCILGSIRDCNLSAIQVTNFLGYPYLIYLGYSVFGYQINLANIVSLLFSSFSIVFIFLCSLLILEKFMYALSCSFVYITIPLFNIYSSTSLTEPLSNSYLILAMMLYLLFVFYPNKSESQNFFSNLIWIFALFFTLIYAIFAKTTNLSLVFCLPLIAFFYIYTTKKKFNIKTVKRNFLMTLPVIIIVILISFTVLNTPGIVGIDKGDIGQNPFSLTYLKDLVPIFLKAFLSFDWHLFYFAFFIIGIVLSIKMKYGLFSVVVFFSFLFLYTSHYRSYYYTRGLSVSIDESFRYMTSFISMYSLIVGLGIYHFLKISKKILDRFKIKYLFKSILIIGLIGILCVSYYFTAKNRSYFIEDEYRSRIHPVKKTLEFVKERNISVLTSDHVLFQIYGPSNLELIDFSSIAVLIPTNMVDEKIENQEVIYLQTMEEDRVNGERYSEQFKYINSREKELLYEEESFKIFRIR